MLAQLMAQVLTAKGYKVTTKIPTGNTDITRAALTSGKIDIYWEFTSSGLAILKQAPIGDPTAAYTKIKGLDAKNGITWLPSASMNDTYALAVLKGGKVTATTLTQLASEQGLSLCADPEGGFRTDVLPVVKTAYGIDFGTKISQIGADLVPQSVKQGKCDVGLVYATSALIPKNNLRILTDDKHAFGAYTPAPTIKTSNLAKYPTLEADLAPLTKALSTDTITQLNAQAGGDDTKIKSVAHDFLVKQNLI